jgi:REP element-mobilizing transposase RayT
MQYRRVFLPGGSFFFTLVTEQRNSIFDPAENIDTKGLAIQQFSPVCQSRDLSVGLGADVLDFEGIGHE